MKVTINTSLIFSIALSLLSVAGCKKFVEVNVPATNTVTEKVFSSDATATSALLNIYQKMHNNAESFTLEQTTGFLGDELKNYSSSSSSIDYYTNSMTALSTYGPWNNAYNYIYQANAIIEGLQDNNAVSAAAIKQLSGEAKFIRAFWFFHLANCYGNIPLPVTTNYEVNAALPQTDRSGVYQQIIADLTDAQNLLNTNFVDATDTVVTTDRVRPTKWAATALLARAYLYSGDYANAEVQATAVINNSGQFSLLTDLSKIFLANSNEAIWQLAIVLPNSYNTVEGKNFILTGAPSQQAISTQLISAFEANDKRRTNWVGTFTTSSSPAISYYYPYKYKVQTGTAVSEYTMVLRLAEQYLIRAEARAQKTGMDLNGAISDLNIIRHRAGLGDYSGTVNQSSVVQAILHERQVELFTEWGHRWFDLVRTGAADAVLGAPGNVCQFKGGAWSPNWKLFPVPQAEINKDHNLSQNTGY